MGLTDSVTGIIRDLRESYRERKRSRRRRREAGVRPGQKVRDGLTGTLLSVEAIAEKRTDEYCINGTTLADYDRNSALDCETAPVVECRQPETGDKLAYPSIRLVPLEIEPGNHARDRFTGDVLTVEQIQDTLAGECSVENVQLSEYGTNTKLSCAGDWVVDCSYHYSQRNDTYRFPLSRLAPGKYATQEEDWKERVRNSKQCFSCEDGRKYRERQSACRSCRGRIFERDGRTCQQKGCEPSDTDDLVVHHLWYRPNPVTGTIPDRHLIVLCNEHHRARHGIES